MKVNVYTVSQINGYIKRLIDNDVFLNGLYIEGEISNFKLHSSGHIYFSLKDATGSVDCVMFKSYAQKLAFVPQNGECVLAGGRISLYEKTGRYQFYAEYMQPAGKGALYMEFEKLKAKLEAEGLFSAEYKKPIPEYPKTVAVVTSPTGAAVRDIINVAGRRNPSVKLVIIPVLVQGENAAEDIARGIALANEWGGADTLIVGRGGGSMEDLWAFNEETVARAVFASKIPVISAVGHEVDFTICDFVSDFRAPTPSAAAELAVPAAQPFEMRYKNAFNRMDSALASRLSNYRLRYEHAFNTRKIQHPLDDIFDLQIYVGDKLEAIKKAAERTAEKCGAGLDAAMASIEALSPVNVIRRGYALAYAKNKLVKSVNDVNVGDDIDINVGDGSILASVRGIKNGGEKTKL